MRLPTIVSVFAVAATAAVAFGNPAFAEDTHIGHGGHAAMGHAGRSSMASHGPSMHTNAPRNFQMSQGVNGSAQRSAARASFAAPNSGNNANRVAASDTGQRDGGRFRGGYGGGYINPAYGAYGAAGYDPDYYGSGYDDAYDDSAYGYGAPGYIDPNYAVGTQYGYDENDTAPVQSGRSAAVTGTSCSTPVKVCTLYQPSYVGLGCSCRIPGGRSKGQVTP
jgi:hypothetical protein